MKNTRFWRFENAERVFWHDKFLAATLLKLFPKWLVPNYVTLFRFFTTPIVAWLMFYGNYKIGLWTFILVAYTDAIDGALARTRNQITEWGKVYDPVADKILIGSMVFIILLRYIDAWTAYLIVFIELIIIFVAWYRLNKGHKVQANVWGKIKMILQVVGVSLLVLSIAFDWAAILPFANATIYLAIAFAVVSLLTYGI
jgi:CDP-diacylglycerol--glycerol-3-phosphate 3-phosphatidyltransferase